MKKKTIFKLLYLYRKKTKGYITESEIQQYESIKSNNNITDDEVYCMYLFKSTTDINKLHLFFCLIFIYVYFALNNIKINHDNN